MRRLITGRRIWVLAATLGGVLWIALLPALGFLFYNLAIWQQEMDAGGRTRQRREYTAAARHYALAIQAAKRLGYERGNQYLARSLNELGLNDHFQGKNPAAERLYRRALAIYAQVWGKDEYLFATIICNLADACASERKYGPAAALYWRAQRLFIRARGSQNLYVAYTCYWLARLYESEGQ